MTDLGEEEFVSDETKALLKELIKYDTMINSLDKITQDLDKVYNVVQSVDVPDGVKSAIGDHVSRAIDIVYEIRVEALTRRRDVWTKFAGVVYNEMRGKENEIQD